MVRVEDSQSRGDGFRILFLSFRSLGNFVNSTLPQLYKSRSNCSVAECFPQKSNWCWEIHVYQGMKCKAQCKD